MRQTEKGMGQRQEGLWRNQKADTSLRVSGVTRLFCLDKNEAQNGTSLLLLAGASRDILRHKHTRKISQPAGADWNQEEPWGDGERILVGQQKILKASRIQYKNTTPVFFRMNARALAPTACCSTCYAHRIPIVWTGSSCSLGGESRSCAALSLTVSSFEFRAIPT